MPITVYDNINELTCPEFTLPQVWQPHLLGFPPDVNQKGGSSNLKSKLHSTEGQNHFRMQVFCIGTDQPLYVFFIYAQSSL